MSPKVSRLLFWGMVWLGGCGSGAADSSDGVDSADGGTRPEAGSGGAWTPSVTGAAGGSTPASTGGAGAQAAPGGRPGSSTGGTVAAVGGSSGGTGGTGGSEAPSGAGGAGGTGGAGAPAAGSGGSQSSAPVPTEKFSFFVTSLAAMQRLSKSDDGFGGDLRYGEATGLAGADKICSEIAEGSMPGAAGKMWRAFLSAKSAGPSGAVVHAKDRVGSGPWYDRTGRLIAMDLASLLQTRPEGADPSIADNLPNEDGEPNRPSEDVDNHDTVTGSNELGEYSGGATCEDWTTTATPAAEGTESGGTRGGGRGGGGRGPMCGHSWPAQSGQSWIRAHNAPGCAPSVSPCKWAAAQATASATAAATAASTASPSRLSGDSRGVSSAGASPRGSLDSARTASAEARRERAEPRPPARLTRPRELAHELK
jgi:hypothetical protein